MTRVGRDPFAEAGCRREQVIAAAGRRENDRRGTGIGGMVSE